MEAALAVEALFVMRRVNLWLMQKMALPIIKILGTDKHGEHLPNCYWIFWGKWVILSWD
jgi:hypothetical protein